jgi:hypothetical protein
MPRYHFSLGDSTVGPIGFCASVRARNKEEGVKTLRRRLPAELAVAEWHAGGDPDGIEYIRVYFNEAAISVSEIDEVEASADNALRATT